MTSQPLFQNIFRRPTVVNFADIIKMFFKRTLENPKKVKRIRNYVLK